MATLFGVQIAHSRYDTFMASMKPPGVRSGRSPLPSPTGACGAPWTTRSIPKTGSKVIACQDTFDRAAKTNQSQGPWAQSIVTVGLLKISHGGRCCLPLTFAFYFRCQTLHTRSIRVRGQTQVLTCSAVCLRNG